MQTRTKHTSEQVCELANITYRQLDYWTRRGWVTPASKNSKGSGYSRYYNSDEAKRVALMGALVGAGIRPSDAHHLTKCGEYDENGVFRAAMHGHVYVEVFP